MPDVFEPFGPTVPWRIRAALTARPPATLRAITCAWDARRVAVRCIFSKPLLQADKSAVDDLTAALVAALPRQSIDMECMVRQEDQSVGDLKLTEWVYTQLN